MIYRRRRVRHYRVHEDAEKMTIEIYWREWLVIPLFMLLMFSGFFVYMKFFEDPQFFEKYWKVYAGIAAFWGPWTLILALGKSTITLDAERLVSKDTLFPFFNFSYRRDEVDRFAVESRTLPFGGFDAGPGEKISDIFLVLILKDADTRRLVRFAQEEDAIALRNQGNGFLGARKVGWRA
jgi:hypothetical protein